MGFKDPPQLSKDGWAHEPRPTARLQVRCGAKVPSSPNVWVKELLMKNAYLVGCKCAGSAWNERVLAGDPAAMAS